MLCVLLNVLFEHFLHVPRLEIGLQRMHGGLQFGRDGFGGRLVRFKRVLHSMYGRLKHIRYSRVMGISQGGSALDSLFDDLLVHWSCGFCGGRGGSGRLERTPSWRLGSR